MSFSKENYFFYLLYLSFFLLLVFDVGQNFGLPTSDFRLSNILQKIHAIAAARIFVLAKARLRF
jgi:hypothetical protein